MHQSTPRDLIIVGAGDHARELTSYVHALKVLGEPVAVHGLADDYWYDATFENIPSLGGIAQLGAYVAAYPDRSFWFITAIGDNRMRATVVRRIVDLTVPNLIPWTMQHQSAVVDDATEVGAGAYLGPGVVTAAQVRIGAHSILDVGSSVSHDSTLGPYVYLGPGASICRGVTVGEGCFIGPGVTVTDGLHVGAWSVVSAGSVVVDNVPANVTMIGSPARIAQRHSRGMRQSPLAG